MLTKVSILERAIRMVTFAMVDFTASSFRLTLYESYYDAILKHFCKKLPFHGENNFDCL